MNETLYVVSTYYHALIAAVIMLNGGSPADIAVTSYISEGDALARRLTDSGLFGNVFLVGNIAEYHPANKVDMALHQHRRNAELIERQLPPDLKIRDYKVVNIFHDDIWISRYLKDRRIPYRLMEDALDSFKHLSDTPFSYMLPHNMLLWKVKKSLRIGYVFCGFDDCTTEVEVNDALGIEITSAARGKIVERPRAPLFSALSDDSIRILRDIFMKEVPQHDPEKSVLLLTRPLFEDGDVPDIGRQIEHYRRIASSALEEGDTLFIKPHPRDVVDYSAAFRDAVIIDRSMPAEILFMGRSGMFRRVLSGSNILGQATTCGKGV